MTSPLDALLEQSPWAQQLPEEALARVRRDTVVREVPADALVCRKGEPVEHWIGVVAVADLDGLSRYEG